MLKKSIPIWLSQILMNTAIWVVIALTISAIFIFWTVWKLESQLPSEPEIRGCLVTSIYKIDLCPKNSNYVKFSQVPRYLVDAIIVSEDGGFWEHSGFDFHEIKESLIVDEDGLRFVRGASTISQQLAKNLYLSPERSLTRKILEGLITLRIERALTKKEILERYLNVIELGPNIFGVRAGAKHYFGKSPRELELLEAVFLTMILPSPKKWSASFFQERLSPFAKSRMSEILFRMQSRQMISSEQYQSTIAKLEYFPRGSGPTGVDPLSLSEGSGAEERQQNFDGSSSEVDSLDEAALPPPANFNENQSEFREAEPSSSDVPVSE